MPSGPDGSAPGQSAELILASNRGPVTFKANGGSGRFTLGRGVGSLAASLRAIADRAPGRVAWLTVAAASDRAAVAAGGADVASRHLGYPVHFVPVDARTYERYYEQASNRLLWFANHALWAEVGIDPVQEAGLAAWTLGYERVNRAFARKAAAITRPDSCLLFQDYHLATAPAHLRLLRPGQPVAHFTHGAFCGPEGLHKLPGSIGRRYIRGMLGADLIGFHTPAWSYAFLDCCLSYGLQVDERAGRVRVGRRWAWVRDYPMPVDAARLRTLAAQANVRAWAARFSGRASRRLLVRVDRVEPAKNILRGFEAFRLLLDRRADLRDTRFVACLYGTRNTMPEYRQYMARIHALVADIQRDYPGSIELFVEDSQERALGALLCYDVLLVNPLRDGMNLVAKEGAVLNERSGVLVLSSGAGAFNDLGSAAVGIRDPESVPQTAAALEQALCMPARQRAVRAASLRSLADRHSPLDWLEWQVRDLRSARNGHEPEGYRSG